MKPTIQFAMPSDEYRKSPGVSKSELDEFAKCPARYKAIRDGLIKREPSDAMTFGTLLHAMVLEGKADFYTKPDGMTFASKDGKAWRDSHNDRPIISQAEANELTRTATAILKHRHAAKLFGDGRAEVSMWGQDKETGLPMKARADWLARSHIVDLKTIRSADNRSCSRAIAEYSYHRQAYYYREIARQNGLDIGAFYFVFLERGDFPLINVRKISEPAIELGGIEVGRLLRDLKACEESGIWLDYSGDGETPGEIDLPPYKYNDTTGMEEIKLDGAIFNENQNEDLIP